LRRLAFAACLVFLCAPASAAVAARGFSFTGSTDQCPADQGRCGSVAIRLSSNLKQVLSFVVEYQAACQNASTPVTETFTARGLPASVKKGTVKFRDTATDKLRLGTGVTGDVTAALSGKLRATGNGSGTASIDIVVRNAAGQQIDTCTTGAKPLRWRARVS
jgi:hypothetical protein